MKTPFTPEQFFDVFRTYNETVFPAQIVLYLLAFILVYLIIRPNAGSHKIISGLLSLFWLWMGIVYHIIFFTEINPAAYIFGVAFIVQSFLLMTFGVLKNRLSFSFRSDLFGWTGIILIVYALIIYPVLGHFLGHTYPASPTFGLPCPTTIFTFGVLLLTDKKCPLVLLIIPFVWSVLGFTAAFSFGVWEDTGLLIAGLVTLPLVMIKNRKFTKPEGPPIRA